MTTELQPILRRPDADIMKRHPGSVLKLGKTHRGREIWMDRDDLVRHTFVAGSTGSGKTELLLSICANAIAVGSGIFLVDGKGDMSTFAKVMALAGEFGRQEDVLLLNMSQDRATNGTFTSHTVDILEGLSTPAVTQVLVSMMSSQPRGDDAMWAGRAIAMLTAVVRALMWIRNAGIEPVTLSSMRDRMTLDRIIDLADISRYPDMPFEIHAGLSTYLGSLPGFDANKRYKQSQTTRDQHGYLEMQTTRLFSSLVDDFGHLFSAGTHHVDMRDVVLNRRIVVVLLPALQKSPAEIANLGRLIVTLVKTMMASAMETPVEGDWADVLDRRPTNADQPFHVIFDEASHYLDDGMALMAAQARSLNFAMTFAVQSISAMENANRGASAAILANTNTHVFMKGGIGEGDAWRGYLPKREKWEASSDGSLLDDQISNARFNHNDPLTLRRKYGLPITPKHLSEAAGAELSAREELQALLDEKAAMKSEFPAFDLLPDVRKLAAGEFFVVRSGEFLKGHSMFVSPDLGRPQIGLVRLVPHKATDRALQKHYGREGRIGAALERLLDGIPDDVQVPSVERARAAFDNGTEMGAFEGLVAGFRMSSRRSADRTAMEEVVSL